jgi:hypothetical protein
MRLIDSMAAGYVHPKSDSVRRSSDPGEKTRVFASASRAAAAMRSQPRGRRGGQICEVVYRVPGLREACDAILCSARSAGVGLESHSTVIS